MSEDSIVLEFGPQSTKMVRDLMRTYGETTAAGLVSRALGLMQVAENYLGDEGELKVFDPHAVDDRDLVPLLMRRNQTTPPHA